MNIGLFQAVCMVLLVHALGSQTAIDVNQTPRPASSIAITPEKIDFASQAVGSSSSPRSTTLTNVSGVSVTISDISASGIDFNETNDCPRQLAPRATCDIAITFTPAVTGPRLGTIIVSGSDPASPRFLVVSGQGE